MLTLLLIFAVLCPARAERPVPPKPGVYSLKGDFEFFQTSADFTDSGSVTTLPNGANYENMTAGLSASYDFTKYLRAFGGFTFSSASSVSNDTTFTTTTSRSNAGINEMTAGAMGWWNFGQIAVAPQLSLVYPFWRVDEDSEKPLIGEGAMKIRAGSWAVWRLKMFQPFGFVGYEYRDGGRASLLPYNVGVHFRLHQWWIQGEFRGTGILSDDSDYTSRGIVNGRDDYLRDVNGGSFRYYSVNPSYSEGALETGYKFSGFGIHAGFAMTVRGNNAADGNLYYGGISYTGRIKFAPVPTAEEIQNEKFEIDKDRYDESLFQEEGDGKKIKRKVRKSKSVDKLLHETEKELQEEN